MKNFDAMNRGNRTIVTEDVPARATVRTRLVNADGLVEIIFAATRSWICPARSLHQERPDLARGGDAHAHIVRGDWVESDGVPGLSPNRLRVRVLQDPGVTRNDWRAHRHGRRDDEAIRGVLVKGLRQAHGADGNRVVHWHEMQKRQCLAGVPGKDHG